MKYKILSQQGLFTYSFRLLKALEADVHNVYIDSYGWATVSIGVTGKDYGAEILSVMGVATNDPYYSGLLSLLTERHAGVNIYPPPVYGAFADMMQQRADALHISFDRNQQITDQQSQDIFSAAASDKLADIDRIIGSVPLSQEKAALLSIHYNGGLTPLNSGRSDLISAIKSGDRAGAWFAIRYKLNDVYLNGDAAKRKKVVNYADRRYYEADIFELYDAPYKPSIKEAVDIYAAFSKPAYWDKAIAYDQAFDAQRKVHGVATLQVSLGKATSQITSTYAVGMNVDWRNIFVSAADAPSTIGPSPLAGGDFVTIAQNAGARLSALVGRNNVLVARASGAIFEAHSGKTYMVNDSSGGAQFHIRGGSTLAIGKNGSLDTFYVDTRKTSTATVLSGGKGADVFNIIADPGVKITVHFVFTSDSISGMESMFSGLVQGQNTRDIFLINPDASDKVYFNGTEWNNPTWTQVKNKTANQMGVENDHQILRHSSDQYYALKSGDIWFSTNPVGDDGAARDPSAGKLATRLGDLDVEFDGFVNGMLGITLPNGVARVSEGYGVWYQTGELAYEDHDEGDQIASADFFTYRGDYLNPGDVAAAIATVSARLFSVDDAENPLIGDASANTLDPGGDHDYVVGGGGGDTILYNLGYGGVAVEEADTALVPANTLVVGEDIVPDQVLVTGDADGNLVLAFGGSDVVTLVSGLRSGGGTTYGVQQVEFADGTIWSYSDLLERALDPATASGAAIYGDLGANVLDTGGVAERAIGGGGGDTFVYEADYGWLVVDESDAGTSPANVLALGSGIVAADVTVTGAEDGDIWLTFADGGQVQIKGGLLSEAGLARGVQSVSFADGSSWSYADLLAKAGTASLDNPDIFGDRGANVLDGGGLASSVTGNGGGDTFVFRLGCGQLTINEADDAATPVNTLAFGAGIDPLDIKVMGSGEGDLLLWVNDDDQVWLANALRSDSETHYGVQTVTFAGGTTWSYADLLARASTASAGSDSIYGDTGANVLDTDGLAQYASGGGGGDTFVYALGYGDIVIAEHDEAVSPANILSFGAGIDPADVSIAGNDDGAIVLTLAGGGSVTLLGALADRADGVQQVTFDDGTIWDYSDLLAGAGSAAGGNGTLYGDGDANDLDPLGTADRVIGGGGGDTIHYTLGYGDLRVEERELLDWGNVNRLAFGAGIDPDDVEVRGNADGDLLLTLASGTVTLTGALLSDDEVGFGAGEVTFADGSVWTHADLVARAGQARAGYTTVYGDASGNMLDAEGAAVIAGGGGGDTIRYEAGYGAVAIDEREPGLAENTLAFGDGILPGSITISQNGNDILLTLGGSDQVRLIDAADPDAAGSAGVQVVSFASGEQWTVDQLLSFLSGDIEYAVGTRELVLDSATLPNGLVPSISIDPSIDPDLVTVDARKADQALILNMPDGGTILLQNILDSASASAQEIVFGDGTIWSFADLLAHSRMAESGHGYLVGTAGAETFDGGGFAQEIVGGGGGDTITYESGYGMLVIDERDSGVAPANQLVFGAGIDPETTYVDSNGEGDIILWVTETDSVVLKGGLLGGAGDARGVQSVTFADGTVWSDADLRDRLLTAELGDFGIYGGRGADILDTEGMVGAAYGGGGGDRFVYELGYGNIDIHEADSASLADNALVFGAGITLSDLVFTQEGGDAIINLSDGGSIRIVGQFQEEGAATSFGLQRLIFDDGSEIQLPTTLFGTPGADTLDPLGRPGLIIGSGGGDTIHYELGYGDVFVREEDAAALPSNTLVLGAGIDPADVGVFGDSDGSIYLEIASGGKIGLENALLSRDGVTYGVQSIAFADGTTWSYADLLAKVTVPNPDAGGIYGDAQANTLDPLGQAWLVSGNGGGDTIVYELGYGDLDIDETDTGATPHNALSFGAGIATGDITVRANDSGELELHLGLDDSTIRLYGALESSPGAARGVQEVHFDDGTIWTYADLLNRALVPVADETLNGDTGANMLDGEGLVSTIVGRGGGDTIRYELGYGDLYIDETDIAGSWLANTLELGAGIDAGDVTVSFQPWDGSIILGLDDGSQIAIANMQSQGADGISYLSFADGTVWDREEIWQHALTGRPDYTSLSGRSTADVIDPNGYATYINGNGGGDLIRYALGYGDLTIYEYNWDAGPDNVLAFEAGLDPEDVRVSLDSWSGTLLLTLPDSSVISVSNFQYNPAYGVQQISFADGTVWDREAILNQTRVGSADNTELYGSDAAEVFDPNGYATMVHSGGGGDTILFDAGYGEVTIDSYDAGFATNKLVLGAGLTASAAAVYAEYGDIVIDFGGGDMVRLQSALGSQDGQRYGVQQVRFADGTVWGEADLRSFALVPQPGQSEIYGTSQSDTIDGLGIVSYINAGGGGDTVRYERGYGSLTIDEVNDTETPNTLVFGSGIDPLDVSVSIEDYYDLRVSLGSGDELLLRDVLRSVPGIYYGFDTFEFADGTTWTRDNLIARLNGGSGDTLVGDGTPNLLDTQGVQTHVIGGGGGDTILYNTGYGALLVEEETGFLLPGTTNTIRFGAGIDPANVIVRGIDSFDPGPESFEIDLGGGDVLTLGGAFTAPFVGQLEFADGTIWSMADVLARSRLTGSGNDSVIGTKFADTYDGGAGNDFIDGRDGDDILIGGAGNDWLSGGAGDDTYRFGLGDGQDIFQESVDWNSGLNGYDVIELGAGIAPGDVQVLHSGTDLYFRIGSGGDTIRIVNGNGYSGGEYIEAVHFDDGTIWSYSDILDRADNPMPVTGPLVGTELGDSLPGGAGDDEIQGLAGNDRLNGRDGNDLLIGGAGNDYLVGGAGDDVYRFAPGDGEDAIQDQDSWPWGTGGFDTVDFAAGIDPADVVVTRDYGGSGLLLSISGTTDSVGLETTLADEAVAIEQVHFAGGTIWTLDDLMQRSAPSDLSLNAVDGTSGDDSLYGTSDNDLISGLAGNDSLDGAWGDDVLVGGTGNDILSGSFGSDVYRFALGDGQDIIRENLSSNYFGYDAIEFGAGIDPTDIVVTQVNDGNDLLLSIDGTTDSITIEGAVNDPARRVEGVRFTDGTVWSHADMISLSSGSMARSSVQSVGAPPVEKMPAGEAGQSSADQEPAGLLPFGAHWRTDILNDARRLAEAGAGFRRYAPAFDTGLGEPWQRVREDRPEIGTIARGPFAHQAY